MSSFIHGKVNQNNPTCEWFIKEFDSKCKTFGDFILSPEFSMGINELFWRLQIFPYGHIEDNGYVSVFLHSRSNFIIKASYEITIKNVKNLKKLEHIFEQDSPVSGFHNFAERKNVLKQLKKCKKSELTIICEFHNVTIINSHNSQFDNSKLKVLNDIGDLFMNKDFYDVTIKANTKEFQAHKIILSARSKVFAAMFKHEMTEKKTNIVEIKDIDSEVLETMLKFIYTGEAIITGKMRKELLIAADKYALDELKNICIMKLEINVDNAIDLLLFADLYNLNKFKKSIVDFIVANAKDIIHKPEFNLLKDMPDILMELFSKQTQNQDKNC